MSFGSVDGKYAAFKKRARQETELNKMPAGLILTAGMLTFQDASRPLHET
jgi:hypothetical protein